MSSELWLLVLRLLQVSIVVSETDSTCQLCHAQSVGMCLLCLPFACFPALWSISNKGLGGSVLTTGCRWVHSGLRLQIGATLESHAS